MPAPVAVKPVDEPVHMATFAPALVDGTGFTVTVTLPDKDTDEHAVVEILSKLYVALAVSVPVLNATVPLLPIVAIKVEPPLILYDTVAVGLPVIVIEELPPLHNTDDPVDGNAGKTGGRELQSAKSRISRGCCDSSSRRPGTGICDFYDCVTATCRGSSCINNRIGT